MDELEPPTRIDGRAVGQSDRSGNPARKPESQKARKPESQKRRQTMAARKKPATSKKVKALPAKTPSAKQAKEVKGGARNGIPIR